MFKNIRSFSVSPWFFACLALMVFVDSVGAMLIILVTVFIHESGHLLTLFLFRIRVRRIRLQGFGISIEPMGANLMSCGQTALVALAGPLFNLLAMGLCMLLSRFFTLPDFLLLFGATNLFLCLFNLIPMPPLDGGKLLVCLLTPVLGEYRAGLAGAVSGVICGVGVLGAGVYVLIDSGMNLSLCVLGCYMLICMAVKIYQYRKKRMENDQPSIGKGALSRTETRSVYRRGKEQRYEGSGRH